MYILHNVDERPACGRLAKTLQKTCVSSAWMERGQVVGRTQDLDYEYALIQTELILPATGGSLQPWGLDEARRATCTSC